MKRILAVVWLLLMASVLPAFAQTYTTFPQFALGSGWTSEVFLANQGLSVVSEILVSFYGDSGAPLGVNSNLGTGPVLSMSLNPGATQVIRFSPSSLQSVGYIVVKYPTLAPVRATEVFRFEQGGRVLAEVGVPQQYPDNNFSFPAEINSSLGISTAVAFANPSFDSASAQPQKLVVNLIRADGSLQETALVSLGAGQHLSIYLNDTRLFRGLDNFTGSVNVSSARPISVLALRQDIEAFGGIATDNGPILAPFAVSGTAVPETEPNDIPAFAQVLSGSALVSGTIGTPDDVDYFRINGKQGDIVSALCSTEGMDSYLDCVLILTKSDGRTLIATNDQDGLYQQNDAFFQTVLPEDGTYYIRVADYWDDGGANYRYSLHVKFLSGSNSVGPGIYPRR